MNLHRLPIASDGRFLFSPVAARPFPDRRAASSNEHGFMINPPLQRNSSHLYIFTALFRRCLNPPTRLNFRAQWWDHRTRCTFLSFTFSVRKFYDVSRTSDSGRQLVRSLQCAGRYVPDNFDTFECFLYSACESKVSKLVETFFFSVHVYVSAVSNFYPKLEHCRYEECVTTSMSVA